MRFGMWGNSFATEVVLLEKLGENEVSKPFNGNFSIIHTKLTKTGGYFF